jgi:sn-glycerol 3-phosphate transport system substrate-binding protein
MKQKFLRILILLVVGALFLAACAQGGAPQQAAPQEEAPAEQEAAAETEVVAEEATAEQEAAAETEAMAEEEGAGEVIQLEFWHAMGGDLGEVVDELVQRFNDSQDKIAVTATYQGSYDDTYNALLASFEAGTEPNITQNFDLAAQTMFDTGRLVPAWQLMEADGYDPNTFIPAVRDYYSDENGMVAMAFNSSTFIVYYNAEMFEAAGLAAPDPEWTFSDFLDYCDALQASGVPFCVAFGTVGWYFEQILANSGGLYFNNDNGRTGRATEALFNQGQGVETFEFLTGLMQNGYAPNLGNTWTETDSVFFTKQSAMLFDSTAGARGVGDTAEFEVKTAFIPHSDSSERNGIIIGGAALWLIDSGDAAENAAAWEFMKFMAALDQQRTWHEGTGYYPVRLDAQDDPELQAFWEENPNFRTAMEELFTTNTTLPDGSTNYPVLGGRAGPFPAIRQILIETYSRVLDDGLTPQDALNEAAEKANEELDNYNAFFAD